MVSVFASGLGLLLFLNMSVNILMVIGFAPVVGLPLPLFSYGGSSFINFISGSYTSAIGLPLEKVYTIFKNYKIL